MRIGRPARSTSTNGDPSANPDTRTDSSTDGSADSNRRTGAYFNA